MGLFFFFINYLYNICSSKSLGLLFKDTAKFAITRQFGQTIKNHPRKKTEKFSGKKNTKRALRSRISSYSERLVHLPAAVAYELTGLLRAQLKDHVKAETLKTAFARGR